MGAPVTDPSILAQLNAPSTDAPTTGTSGTPVTDPATLAQLNASDDSASPPETVGRVAGLAARGVATGAAGLPDTIEMLTSPVGYFAGKAIRNVTGEEPIQSPSTPYKPQLSDFVHPDKWQQAAEYFADKAGMPSPQTPGERIGYAAAQALPSAALAPEAPVLGALSAAGGAAASQGVKEAGGSPLQQTLAGLAVGSIPAAASGIAQVGRALVRNQPDTAANVANAAASNVSLTAGQATGSKVLQTAEAASGKVWGGGAIDRAADAQTGALSSRVDDIVSNLAPGADISPTGAGEAINAGVANAKQGMKAAEGAAYGKVDSLVPPATPVDLSGTLAKLDSLASPTPGAEATTGALVSPKIAAMRDNLQADIAANPANTPGGAGAIPYGAARQLRTAVGNSIDWGFAPADPVTNGGLRQIYGALSDDLTAGASKVSPEAAQAATDANSLYASNSAKRELLNTVVDKAGGPETVYQAATNGTKQGATKIDGVMSALDPDNQNIVRATVLDRLGRAPPGQQNAAGDAFNASTFLTNWNRLAPEAKDALFGSSGTPSSLRSGLDSLTKTMETLRNSNALVNPSGTAKAGGHAWGLWSLLGEASTAALTGHPGVAAATVGGGVATTAANAVLARALTNPRTVNWLAQSAKLPPSALPNAVNQLALAAHVNRDPDAQALADYLRQTQPGS